MEIFLKWYALQKKFMNYACLYILEAANAYESIY